MELSPEKFEQWIAILGKPTMGVVVVFILVWYRDLVTEIVRVPLSWLKRK